MKIVKSKLIDSTHALVRVQFTRGMLRKRTFELDFKCKKYISWWVVDAEELKAILVVDEYVKAIALVRSHLDIQDEGIDWSF